VGGLLPLPPARRLPTLMAVGSTGRASLESFIWQREGEAEAGNAKGALRSD